MLRHEEVCHLQRITSNLCVTTCMNDIVVEVIRKINRARRKLEYIQRSQQLEELIWSPHKSFSISRASKNNFESKITFVSDVADD